MARRKPRTRQQALEDLSELMLHIFRFLHLDYRDALAMAMRALEREEEIQMVMTKGRDKCWLCGKGQIVEAIEENVKVPGVPGAGAITLPKARVGRCDQCHNVLYVLRVD